MPEAIARVAPPPALGQCTDLGVRLVSSVFVRNVSQQKWSRCMPVAMAVATAMATGHHMAIAAMDPVSMRKDMVAMECHAMAMAVDMA